MVDAPSTSQAPLAPLYAALAKAQKICKTAEKDGRFQGNKFSYPYTSANERIEVAREALSSCGLALVRHGLPRFRRLKGVDEHGVEVGELLLEVNYVLAHESGVSIPVGYRWPVLVGEWRPFDKAAAVAATGGLSYLLRDLLLMPSAEADDPDHTTNEVPEGATARPAAPSGPVWRPPAAKPTTLETSAPAPSDAPTSAAAAPDPGPAKVTEAFHAIEALKAKLAAAPLLAPKLLAGAPELRSREIAIEALAALEPRFGSRARVLEALAREVGVPPGAVPTLGELRQLVELAP